MKDFLELIEKVVGDRLDAFNFDIIDLDNTKVSKLKEIGSLLGLSDEKMKGLVKHKLVFAILERRSMMLIIKQGRIREFLEESTVSIRSVFDEETDYDLLIRSLSTWQSHLKSRIRANEKEFVRSGRVTGSLEKDAERKNQIKRIDELKEQIYEAWN